MENAPEMSRKPRTTVRCPKCGHEFDYGSVWLKVSILGGRS